MSILEATELQFLALLPGISGSFIWVRLLGICPKCGAFLLSYT